MFANVELILSGEDCQATTDMPTQVDVRFYTVSFAQVALFGLSWDFTGSRLRISLSRQAARANTPAAWGKPRCLSQVKDAYNTRRCAAQFKDL